MYYYTYLLVSKQDNRLYIGSRGCPCKPEEDTSYMSSSKVESKEYLQNCLKIVLKTFLTRADALKHEIFLHEAFDVGNNPYFFNKVKQTTTKFDRSGQPLTLEHRKRISMANKISCNTPESKEKYRNNRLGKRLSDTTKSKLRECNLGGKSAKAKPILCKETGVVFEAISEAAIWAKVHYSSIVKVCNNKQRTAGGYTWQYINTKENHGN